MGRIIPYIMENKKCLKPPTSLSFNGRMHQTSILLADKKYPANKSFFDLPKVPSPTGICPPRPPAPVYMSWGFNHSLKAF